MKKRRWMFAAGFCVLMFLFGCLLGARSLRDEQVLTANTEGETTVPEISAATAPTQSPESQLYSDYFLYHGNAQYQTYTTQDLDGNGITEMLIWNGDSLTEVMTIQDGVICSILSGKGLFLCENWSVGEYSEGSGGCTLCFYQISGQQANPVECLVWLFEKDTWYKSPDFTGNWNTMTEISEEERMEILGHFRPAAVNADSYSFLKSVYSEK